PIATTDLHTLCLHDALPISCRGRIAGAPGAGAARSAPAARRASRQQGAQRIQVDLGQLLQRAELDVLVELVDAGIDRPEFNHLRDRKSTRLNSSHQISSYAV